MSTTGMRDAMSGTEAGCRPIMVLCSRYAMPGTDVGYAAARLGSAAALSAAASPARISSPLLVISTREISQLKSETAKSTSSNPSKRILEQAQSHTRKRVQTADCVF
eukprot:225033-Rhodomonas_salina.16